MKRLVVLPLLFAANQVAFAADNILTTDQSKESYSIGYDFGKNVSTRLMDIELQTFIKGFEDAFPIPNKSTKTRTFKSLPFA